MMWIFIFLVPLSVVSCLSSFQITLWNCTAPRLLIGIYKISVIQFVGVQFYKRRHPSVSQGQPRYSFWSEEVKWLFPGRRPNVYDFYAKHFFKKSNLLMSKSNIKWTTYRNNYHKSCFFCHFWTEPCFSVFLSTTKWLVTHCRYSILSYPVSSIILRDQVSWHLIGLIMSVCWKCSKV